MRILMIVLFLFGGTRLAFSEPAPERLWGDWWHSHDGMFRVGPDTITLFALDGESLSEAAAFPLRHKSHPDGGYLFVTEDSDGPPNVMRYAWNGDHEIRMYRVHRETLEDSPTGIVEIFQREEERVLSRDDFLGTWDNDEDGFSAMHLVLNREGSGLMHAIPVRWRHLEGAVAELTLWAPVIDANKAGPWMIRLLTPRHLEMTMNGQTQVWFRAEMTDWTKFVDYEEFSDPTSHKNVVKLHLSLTPRSHPLDEDGRPLPFSPPVARHRFLVIDAAGAPVEDARIQVVYEPSVPVLVPDLTACIGPEVTVFRAEFLFGIAEQASEEKAGAGLDASQLIFEKGLCGRMKRVGIPHQVVKAFLDIANVPLPVRQPIDKDGRI